MIALLTLLAVVSGATPDVGSGPNHRAGAPFRAKLSPPLAAGTVLVVKGRVHDADGGAGLAGVVIDAYQADATGHYDMRGYAYRARLVTDESGAYELETIVPANYGPPPHIHLIVSLKGYVTLRTEMRLRDEAHPQNDRPELTPELFERRQGEERYLEGTFDLVLRREPS
jgi:catechol 1,2-dioxygenase